MAWNSNCIAFWNTNCMAWQDFIELSWKTLIFECCALKRYVKSVCHSYKYSHNTLPPSFPFCPSPTTNMEKISLFKVFSVFLCRISHTMQECVTHMEMLFLLVKSSKFWFILGTHGYWSVRVLLRKTPSVARDIRSWWLFEVLWHLRLS